MTFETDKVWHLKKEISVGNILTVLTVVGGVLLWGLTLEGRVSLNSQALVVLTESTTKALEKHEKLTAHEGQAEITTQIIADQAETRARLDNLVESNRDILIEIRLIRGQLSRINGKENR